MTSGTADGFVSYIEALHTPIPAFFAPSPRPRLVVSRARERRSHANRTTVAAAIASAGDGAPVPPPALLPRDARRLDLDGVGAQADLLAPDRRVSAISRAGRRASTRNPTRLLGCTGLPPCVRGAILTSTKETR